jgi:hypothetical protein
VQPALDQLAHAREEQNLFARRGLVGHEPEAAGLLTEGVEEPLHGLERERAVQVSRGQHLERDERGADAAAGVTAMGHRLPKQVLRDEPVGDQHLADLLLGDVGHRVDGHTALEDDDLLLAAILADEEEAPGAGLLVQAREDSGQVRPVERAGEVGSRPHRAVRDLKLGRQRLVEDGADLRHVAQGDGGLSVAGDEVGGEEPPLFDELVNRRQRDGPHGRAGPVDQLVAVVESHRGRGDAPAWLLYVPLLGHTPPSRALEPVVHPQTRVSGG